MIPINDYHMHTPLCGHALGLPAEYARHAVKVGLQEIGFSDHAPFVHMVDPGVTMNMSQLPEYYKMIEHVQHEYKNELRIKMAIEADFIPGYESKTKAILDDYPYDYVIGSVHFIKDWGFDDPSQRKQWSQQDVNTVYRDYYKLLQECAKSGMYNIMAHCDLVKKFGNRATIDLTDEITKTAQVFKETGVAIEINTSGWRKPCKEQYPAENCLKIYAAHQIPLTFGSDAHDPVDVGADFTRAYDLVKACGFKEYVIFNQKKIERSIKL
ncbi:MAG: histidinol-phosphatase HisJ family protein [Candidatus Omnitrophica bacterium]|nr:histidinol-phosphatase HisJ family protein [Candidatus Omnitrophota bacterium]